jgi:glycosyltransferase involved in cell wall biosynthesis
MPALLELVDACFIGWQKKALYRFGISPNKVLDYMMAGKPIIQAAAEGNDLVSLSNCGLTVPSENPSAIAAAVKELMNYPLSEREAMGLRGRQYVQLHHDYAHLARRYLEILQ